MNRIKKHIETKITYSVLLKSLPETGWELRKDEDNGDYYSFFEQGYLVYEDGNFSIYHPEGCMSVEHFKKDCHDIEFNPDIAYNNNAYSADSNDYFYNQDLEKEIKSFKRRVMKILLKEGTIKIKDLSPKVYDNLNKAYSKEVNKNGLKNSWEYSSLNEMYEVYSRKDIKKKHPLTYKTLKTIKEVNNETNCKTHKRI